MTVLIIKDQDQLKALVGQELGVTPWREMPQEQVNLFADATEDHQWIHTDIERAREGAFGGTIVHGYLMLSLLPKFASEIFEVAGVTTAINYGLNKVRFLQPVLTGSRIRCRAALVEVEDRAGASRITVSYTIEIEGAERPACVAETISLLRFS